MTNATQMYKNAYHSLVTYAGIAVHFTTTTKSEEQAQEVIYSLQGESLRGIYKIKTDSLI